MNRIKLLRLVDNKQNSSHLPELIINMRMKNPSEYITQKDVDAAIEEWDNRESSREFGQTPIEAFVKSMHVKYPNKYLFTTDKQEKIETIVFESVRKG